MLVSEGQQSRWLEMERMRMMAASSGGMTTSLGLGVEIGGGAAAGLIVVPNRQSPPVELDLLPMRSSHSSETSTPAPSSVTNPLSWQMLASRTNSGSAEGYVDDGEVETYSSVAAPDVGVSMTRDMIDINELPTCATTDGDEFGAVVSSPASSIGMVKQETGEILHVFHHDHLEQSDRGFELSSRGRAAPAGGGGGISDDEDGGSTRKKLRLSKEQSALLEESFKDHSTLNPKQKTALAKQLHLRPRQVEVWFQNRRARTKLKQTEVDCELLKRCCESLTQENRRLRKELQELRALKLVTPPAPAPTYVLAAAHHDFYMPLPATTLTMCPSCKRVATVDADADTQMRPAHTTFPQPVKSFSHNFLQPSAAC